QAPGTPVARRGGRRGFGRRGQPRQGRSTNPVKKSGSGGGEPEPHAAGRHDRPETRFGGQTCKGGPYTLESRARLGLRYAQNEAIWWLRVNRSVAGLR